jgi:hypothetical protein
MCKKSREPIDHLLLHCEVAREIRSSLFQLFSVSWVMLRRVSELLVSLRGQLRHLAASEVWKLAPLWSMWCIQQLYTNSSIQ